MFSSPDLWKEFFETYYRDEMNMLSRKVKQATEILERFRDWNHKYVMFSGGKDSLVCLDLASRVWGDNFRVIYIEITGNTHEKCTDYAYRIAEEYGVELIHLKYEENFFDVLKAQGYPSIIWGGSRWCLNKFKDRPLSKFKKCNSLTVTVSGIKQGDSPSRRNFISNKAVDGVVRVPRKNQWGKVQLIPIYSWSKNDVWQYIKDRELPLNPLYGEIGFSGNCLICPGIKKSEFLAVMEKCPDTFCSWRKAHEKLREDYTKNCLRGAEVVFHKFEDWYRTYCLNRRMDENYEI